MVHKLILRIFSIFIVILFGLSQTVSIARAEEVINKFGIHISDIDETAKASELVGEWGYVTFVINSNDRSVSKWQSRFNELNNRKLIPIVRIATYANGSNWEHPVIDDPKDWAKFLNSLYWPTKKKIVVLYNEPNHGTEWGGSVDPGDFALHIDQMITELKKISPDFVVLNPGFDSSAPQQFPRYMDQVAFMDAMETIVPGIFSKFDGWSSHSYPNPGFSGKPTDTGRGTVSGYKWELDLLKTRYKVQKDLPVYITETGWPYKNKDHADIKIDAETAASYIETAYQNIWMQDDRVKAVTPFMLVYRSPVFSHFSWLNDDNSETPMFSKIKSMQKKPGDPLRESNSVITSVTVPSKLEKDSQEEGSIVFKNTGNTIWSAVNPTSLAAFDPEKVIVDGSFQIAPNQQIMPGQNYVFKFKVGSNTEKTRAAITFQMQHDGKFFGEKLYVPILIYQSPKLRLSVANPPAKQIGGVTITFTNGIKQEVFKDQKISENGQIGTFNSHLFVPDEKLSVKIESKNRDPIIGEHVLWQGENSISYSLPEEKSMWQRFIEIFK